MIQYLTILLDDSSTSYCHYDNMKRETRLIPIDLLRKGILFGMRENLNIQFVYPNYNLDKEYLETIDSIDHIDIKPFKKGEYADIVVLEQIIDISKTNATVVLRIPKEDFFENVDIIKILFSKTPRLNIIIKDVDTFTDDDFILYEKVLKDLAIEVEFLYVKGLTPQVNLITDRMMLKGMNNCGAGDTSITLAPDGCFYLCPAFYLVDDGENYGLGKSKFNVGNLEEGLDIKNSQLYKISHAPLCRICDAYHCKRCIWFNRKTTYEVNTPSHEQCVTAHIERNVARQLLTNIRQHGEFLHDMPEINEINYLDPFDVKEKW